MATAATTANSSAFPRFQDLPLELRDQIWHDSLPAKDKPALYPWRKGCWCLRSLQESDKEWDNEYLNLRFGFRHDLLDHVQVEMPLFSVNREARLIALVWMHKQNINIRFRKDKQCYVFTRPFDPMVYVLYIAIDEIGDFSVEPIHRLGEPDLDGQGISAHSPEIRRIAVPVALFPDNVFPLP